MDMRRRAVTPHAYSYTPTLTRLLAHEYSYTPNLKRLLNNHTPGPHHVVVGSKKKATMAATPTLEGRVFRPAGLDDPQMLPPAPGLQSHV